MEGKNTEFKIETYDLVICKDDFYYEKLISSYFKNRKMKGGESENEK